jgi:hypothetical protein
MYIWSRFMWLVKLKSSMARKNIWTNVVLVKSKQDRVYFPIWLSLSGTQCTPPAQYLFMQSNIQLGVLKHAIAGMLKCVVF